MFVFTDWWNLSPTNMLTLLYTNPEEAISGVLLRWNLGVFPEWVHRRVGIRKSTGNTWEGVIEPTFQHFHPELVAPSLLDRFLFQSVINPDYDLNCPGMQIPMERFLSPPNMSLLDIVVKTDGTPRWECLSSCKHKVPQTPGSDSSLLSNYSKIP